MSLFNRKTALGGGIREINAIDSFAGDVLGAGTFGLVGNDVFGLDLTGAQASKDAAAASAAGSQAGIEEQRRQFDLTRADLLPFLEQATGKGGALDKFVAGIDQAPGAPQLQDFQFDPNTVLDNPEFQFIRDQGNIALDRQAGKNRRLGSGQRLIDAQNFGQGLATRFIDNEFNRGLTLNNQTNNRLLQQQGLDLQNFNDRMNRLAGLVDVGRGTGGTLAQAGQGTSNAVSSLLQSQGDARAAGILGGQQGFNDLLNTGITAAGFAFGGPAGGVAANRLSPVGGGGGFTPIGAQDSQGFFG